jgi:hypothetical protein
MIHWVADPIRIRQSSMDWILIRLKEKNELPVLKKYKFRTSGTIVLGKFYHVFMINSAKNDGFYTKL